MIGHVSSAFRVRRITELAPSTVNKSPSECMSLSLRSYVNLFFTDVPYEKQLPSESGFCVFFFFVAGLQQSSTLVRTHIIHYVYIISYI